MFIKPWTILGIIILLVLIGCQCMAQGVPDSITYQGKLTTIKGHPVADGSYEVQFKFYTFGGVLLWTSAPVSVTTTGGSFTTVISSIPTNVFSGSDVWLETLVGGVALSPRVKFTSVPYALRAGGIVPGWSLTGNSGTDAATNYVGTTDNQPLELRTNGSRALRLEYTSLLDMIQYSSSNVIGGWRANSAAGGLLGATIAGGGFRTQVPKQDGIDYPNRVLAHFGTVSGGSSNTAGAGSASLFDKGWATVGGGQSNTASGKYSLVPGGLSNTASGDYSFAAGRRAQAGWPGSFVWGDSTDADINATGANQFIVRATGGVGINTNLLTHALTVSSTTANTLRLIGPGADYGHQGKINFGDGNIVYIQEDVDDSLLIKANRLTLNANVGIGTTEPTQRLQVESGNILVKGPGNFGSSGSDAILYLGDTANYVRAVRNGGLRFGSTGEADVVTIHNGLVGIGPISYGDKLAVAGNVKVDSADTNNGTFGSGGLIKFGAGATGEGIGSKRTSGGNWAGIDFYTAGNTRMSITNSGNVGIGTTSPGSKLDVRGNIRVLSASTGVVVVELGEGLDYAEGFDVSDRDNASPGTVLIIDPDSPGKLAISSQAYDARVAGIVAGANDLGSGVRLGVGKYDHDVALAGRVYCNVDATHAGVEPGDLLTTSDTPGYAMKAQDRSLSSGAVLGKAMQRLEKGKKGQILVLVTLQ